MPPWGREPLLNIGREEEAEKTNEDLVLEDGSDALEDPKLCGCWCEEVEP